jgi:hypothetical protein
MFIICGGFGSIAIVGYLSPIVELSPVDGRCRIGLPSKVSFPLMCFDVGVNLLLTGVFFWLLKPVLSHHGVMSLDGLVGGKLAQKLRLGISKGKRRTSGEQYTHSQRKELNKNIKTLLWKCLVGSTLVMLPTVGNMVQFYVMNGRELGWICLTVCTLDGKLSSSLSYYTIILTNMTAVSWGVIVVNWLTIGSAKAEKNLTTLISQQTLCVQEEPNVGGFNSYAQSSLTERPRAVVLLDEGKLLGVDSSVSPVKRGNKYWVV